jgi:TetR/AcrR family transcriptional regulator, regulator of mycofactocin system
VTPDDVTGLPVESLALQLRIKRSELMIQELEAVALRLFDQRGFKDVTVDEIVSEAHTSARTFYRYFPNKEDVLQVQIYRRSRNLDAALSARPASEQPLQSLRLALAEVLATEDPEVVRRWIAIIIASPSVLNSVIGGIQLKIHRVIAEFLGDRLGLPGDALVPTMMAAASGGVIQAAHVDWYVNGGDLAAKVSEAFFVLEQNRIGPLGDGLIPAEPTRRRAPRKHIQPEPNSQQSAVGNRTPRKPRSSKGT